MTKTGAKIIRGLQEAIAGDLARVTIEGQAWERVRPRSPGAIAITLLPREDGGLRLCSETHPGLILSGTDPEKVLAAVWPALNALRAHNNR